MKSAAHGNAATVAAEPGFPEVVADALEVLSRERQIFLAGDYGEIPRITSEKILVLERIEDAILRAPKTATTIAAIEDLVTASRRNEEIIQAARQGLAHARRRIGSIRQARRGIVAYAEDGSQIASQADMIGREKSA